MCRVPRHLTSVILSEKNQLLMSFTERARIMLVIVTAMVRPIHTVIAIIHVL